MACEVQVAEVDPAEVETSEVDETEIDVPQVDRTEVEVAEVPEVDAAEVDVPEVEATEVDVTEVHVAEVEVPELQTADSEATTDRSDVDRSDAATAVACVDDVGQARPTREQSGFGDHRCRGDDVGVAELGQAGRIQRALRVQAVGGGSLLVTKEAEDEVEDCVAGHGVLLLPGGPRWVH